MTNCSDNLKRKAIRRERSKQRTRRLIFLAAVLSFAVGFLLGRIPVWAITDRDPEPMNTVTPEILITPSPEPAPEVEWVTYRVTAYCACEICCGEWAKNRPDGIVYGAAGVPLEQGVSCASPLPFGTEVEIEGLGTYVVQDRIASWVVDKYGENLIDIYFSDHEAACAFGLQYLNVCVKEKSI